MEDDYKLFEPNTQKANPTKNPIYGLMKSTGAAIMSDTPKWAKIVRLLSIGLIATGLALSSANPITLPAAIAVLIPYGGTMELVGTIAATIVQFTTKKE